MFKIFQCIILLSVSTFAFSDIADSTANFDSTAVKNIQKKLDEINAKLTLLIEEKNDNNHLYLTKNLKDGKGLSFTIRPGEYSLSSISVDASYIFKPRNTRYGLLIGGYKTIYSNSNTDHAYVGIMIGTPIFFNFLSVSGFYEYQYYRYTEFYQAINGHSGYSLGTDLEIWATPMLCFTIGSSATVLNRKQITTDRTALLGAYTVYDAYRFGIRICVPSRKK